MIAKTILAAACATLLASSASAAVLTLDGGWQGFTFAGTGSTWSTDFTFTLTGTAYFAVTDAFCAGDQFAFAVNGSPVGVTSVPTTFSTCFGGEPGWTADPDTAYASSIFSHGQLALGAGSYTITGSTLASPFDAGTAFVQLSSTSLGGPAIEPPTVPLPAAGFLLFGGLGGLAVLRRKSRKA